MIKNTQELLGDRVIIKAPEEGETKSGRGKIILSETATRGEATWGEVIKVGPGIRTQNGELIRTTISVGDMVLYKKDMVGDKTKIEGTEYIMFREHDLLMVDRKSPATIKQGQQLLND